MLYNQFMSFLNALFGKGKTHRCALFDINAGSVGAAYAVVPAGELPQLIYTLRLPIEMRTTESPEEAMERTLAKAGKQLVHEGAPILFRATGSGSADVVLASIAAPWQEMSIRTERVIEKKPFVFTKSVRDQMLSKAISVAPDRILVDESSLGTVLNGYVVQDPFGKKVTHADLVVLTSTLAKEVASIVGQVLQTLFHTKEILFIAGASLRYQVICSIFATEKNYLILDANGPDVSVALIRNGVMVATRDLKGVVRSEKRWVEEVRIALRELAEEYPLPRTIFLVAPERKRDSLKETLSGPHFESLWLSDVPPYIITLTPSHFDAFAKHVSMSEPDLPLLLMTLHAESTLHSGHPS